MLHNFGFSNLQTCFTGVLFLKPPSILSELEYLNFFFFSPLSKYDHPLKLFICEFNVLGQPEWNEKIVIFVISSFVINKITIILEFPRILYIASNSV